VSASPAPAETCPKANAAACADAADRVTCLRDHGACHSAIDEARASGVSDEAFVEVYRHCPQIAIRGEDTTIATIDGDQANVEVIEVDPVPNFVDAGEHEIQITDKRSKKRASRTICARTSTMSRLFVDPTTLEPTTR
jgi:hypothetical protein